MTGENYTSTFGGENVSPANLSYIAYTVDEPLQLTWAFEAVSGDHPTADKIDINSSVTNVLIKMPPANQVTVGQDVLFGNIGAQSYVVADHDGNTICVVAPGVEWFLWISKNTTPAGEWRLAQFGASTSVANASELAGAGLRARLTKLDQDLVTVNLTASYTLLDSDRARVFTNTGGNVTYTLPNAGTVGNGWFAYVINGGSGNIFLTPIGGQTIDGAANKTIAPGESLAVLSDGVKYHTLGYGRSVVTSVTGVSIPVGGTGTIILNGTQIAAQVQDYSGVLTGNRRIEYGGATGYWFVYNNTTPTTPFTMTMAAGPADTGAVIPQGAFSIIRSNGTNMNVALSTTSGTVTMVATTANMIGGPITTSGTLDLSNTGVAPATYGANAVPFRMPTIAIDAKGRITAAGEYALGTMANYNAGSGPGQVPILDSGGNIPSQNGGLQPGDVVYSIAQSKPGFVFANGTTIGNAASGAGQRANADTWPLFKVLWAMPAAQAPMYDSAGNPVGRAANDAADFNANRRITVIDLRGTIIAGLDNAGGVASAGRLNIMASTTLGAVGGAQTEQANINIPQLQVRNGGWAAGPQGYSGRTSGGQSISIVSDGASLLQTGLAFGGSGQFTGEHTHAVRGNTGGEALVLTDYGSYGLTDAYNAIGSTTAANNVQPTMVMNPFIKL